MMNEHIQEIAEQATAYCDTLDIADQAIYRKIWQREFAELIVRECTETINAVPNGYVDYRNQIEDAMREACVDAVKQKFGVE